MGKIKKNGKLSIRAILSGRPLKNGAIREPTTKYNIKKGKRKSGGKIMQGYKAGGKV